METVDRNIVFVVGVGRSGTSLLQSMLNAHPAVRFTPETQFVRKYLATSQLENLFRKGGVDALSPVLKKDTALARLGLSEDELMDTLASCADHFSTRKLYLALLDRYLSIRGDTVWLGDKDPRSIEYLPVIHRHFPHARILHLVRDPRDVLASKKKAAWSMNRSIFEHIFANRVQLKIGRRQGKRLFGDKYLELTYEELIGNTETALTYICRFLNLDYKPAMLLDFAGSSRELVSQDEMQWKKETLGPLMTKNTGNWKQSLAPKEAALCERACHKTFELFAYSRSHSMKRLGIGNRFWVMEWFAILAAMDPLYRFYRNWRIRS